MQKLPKIKIVYEDNHLLVVEKPSNIPVQEDSSKDIDMITLLKEYRKTNENKPGEAYIGLVHRLDRPVSGIMVFAKTSKAASRLSDQIRRNKFKKTYLAVVENSLPQKGKLEDYLTKNEKENKSYITTKETKEQVEKIKYKDYENYTEQVITKIDSPIIRSNVISNENYTIAMNQKGEGFSKYKNIYVNRFKKTSDGKQGIFTH